MKPSWTGSSTPSCSSPSTVRTSWPPAIAARTVHDLTGSPSSQVTQVPQLLVSQPQWVPVSPSSSRRKWTSSMRPSISRVTVSPLTLMVTCISAVPSWVACLVTGHARLDALDRGAQRAPRQLIGEVAFVVGRAAVVGGGRAAFSGDRAGPGVELLGRLLAAQRLGDRGDAAGVRADRRQAHPGVGDDRPVHPDRGARGGDRPVARAPLDLRVGTRPVRTHGDPDLGEDLVVLHRGLVRAAV